MQYLYRLLCFSCHLNVIPTAHYKQKTKDKKHGKKKRQSDNDKNAPDNIRHGRYRWFIACACGFIANGSHMKGIHSIHPHCRNHIIFRKRDTMRCFKRCRAIIYPKSPCVFKPHHIGGVHQAIARCYIRYFSLKNLVIYFCHLFTFKLIKNVFAYSV